MLVTCFDISGILHFEFIPQGQTVKQAYYVEVRQRLYEAVHRKMPGLWPNDWILLNNNAPAHKVLSSSFWSKNSLLKWNTIPIPVIWFQMTSGYFQKQSLPERDEDFRIMKTSKKKKM
jgi:hypothetical protein